MMMIILRLSSSFMFTGGGGELVMFGEEVLIQMIINL
jgi:hypothetical protein